MCEQMITSRSRLKSLQTTQFDNSKLGLLFLIFPTVPKLLCGICGIGGSVDGMETRPSYFEAIKSARAAANYECPIEVFLEL